MTTLLKILLYTFLGWCFIILLISSRAFADEADPMLLCNVIVHEAGHLAGLQHTDDGTVMDKDGDGHYPLCMGRIAPTVEQDLVLAQAAWPWNPCNGHIGIRWMTDREADSQTWAGRLGVNGMTIPGVSCDMAVRRSLVPAPKKAAAKKRVKRHKKIRRIHGR